MRLDPAVILESGRCTGRETQDRTGAVTRDGQNVGLVVQYLVEPTKHEEEALNMVLGWLWWHAWEGDN